MRENSVARLLFGHSLTAYAHARMCDICSYRNLHTRATALYETNRLNVLSAKQLRILLRENFLAYFAKDPTTLRPRDLVKRSKLDIVGYLIRTKALLSPERVRLLHETDDKSPVSGLAGRVRHAACLACPGWVGQARAGETRAAEPVVCRACILALARAETSMPAL